MANALVESGVSLPPDGAAAAKSGPDQKLRNGFSLDDIQFLANAGISPETSRNRRGQVEKTPTPEKTPMDEVRADFKEYLKGYMHRMLRLHHTLPPDQFDALMGEAGEHFLERELFNHLTKQRKEGSDTKGREIDTALLDKFMNTNRGLGIAYQLRKAEFNLQAAFDAVQIGLDGGMVGGPGTIDTENVHIEGAGVVRKSLEAGRRFLGRPVRQGRGIPNPDQGRYYQPGPGRLLRVRQGVSALFGTRPNNMQEAIAIYGRQIGLSGIGGSAMGMALGRMLEGVNAMDSANGTMGLVAGASAAAIYGLIRRSNREGTTLDITECVRAFQGINAAESRWLSEFSGRHTADYEVITVNGQDQIRLRPGRTPETTDDRVTRRNALVGHAEALMKFQQVNNVPESQISTMDNAWALGNDSNIQTGEDFSQRVDRYYNPNRGLNPTQPGYNPDVGRRDVNGRTYERFVPAMAGNPARWERDPLFDANNLDEVGNAARYRRAYRRVVIEEVQRFFKDLKESEGGYNPRNNLLADIERQKQNTGANSPAIQREMRELNDLLGEDESGTGGALGHDRDSVEALRTTFEEFRHAAHKLTEEETKRTRLLARVQGAGGAAPADAAALRREINSVLRPNATAGIEITVDGETIGNLQERQRQLDVDIEDQLNGSWRTSNPRPTPPTPTPGTDPAILAANTQAQAAFETRLTAYNAAEQAERERLRRQPGNTAIQNAINEDQTKLTNILTTLKTSEETTRTEQKKLTNRNPDNETRTNTQEALHALHTAAEQIANGVAIPGNLDRAALSTEPITVLLNRINAANTANNNFGWPAAENMNSANRDLLVQAMVDARTAAPTPEFAAAIDANVWDLAEYDLLTMDTAGIQALVNARAPLIGATPLTTTEIDALRDFARTRNTQRTIAFTAVDRQLAQIQRGETRRRARLRRQHEENLYDPMLVAAERHVNRVDHINGAMEHVDMAALLSDVVINRTNIDDQNRYTAYEDGSMRAYANMMELMYGHRSDNEAAYNNERGAQAAYARNRVFLSQDQLQRLLNTHFRLNTTTFAQSVRELNARFTAQPPRLSREQLAFFFTEIVIYGRTTGGQQDGGFVKQRVGSM